MEPRLMPAPCIIGTGIRGRVIAPAAMIDPFGRAKLLLSLSCGRLARRLALPVGMSHQRPRRV